MIRFKSRMFLDLADKLSDVADALQDLMSEGGAVINERSPLMSDDPEFREEHYDADLEAMSKDLWNLEDILRQYIKEETEYYESQKMES